MDLQSPTANVSAANPALADAPPRNHPPYAEMISAALRERNGSTKDAIANYIETNFTELPPSHAALLTDHLNRLKISGQILQDDQCYKLAGSASSPVTAVNGAVSPDPAFTVTKRRPGRPPKLKPYFSVSGSSNPASPGAKRRPGRPPKSNSASVQVAVPVFEPSIDINTVPVIVPSPDPEQNADLVRVNGPPPAAAVPVVRGRGRPPKLGGFKLGPKIGGAKRGRGRPRIHFPVVQRLAPVGAATDAVGVELPAIEGGVAPLLKKRRGRPPRADGEVKRLKNMNSGKPRRLTGKALGRPRKNPPAAATIAQRSPDSQLLAAYIDQKTKIEFLELKIRTTAKFIKPSLSSEASISALEDLEKVAANMVAPPVPQNQQQPPPEEVRLGNVET